MNREVLRDALVYLPARVVPALVGILGIPILTRLLSPEDYGHYLLAMTTLTLIAGLTVSWLVSITIRFYVVYGLKQLFRTSRSLLAAALMLGSVLWVITAFGLGHPFANRSFVAAGLLWVTAHTVFEYFTGWLRARNLAGSYSVAVSWRSVAGLTATVMLLSTGSVEGETAILGSAIAMSLALVLLPRYALRDDRSNFGSANSQTHEARLQTILRYGVPAAISNLLTVGLSFADRYVIQGYLGTESVAVYGASYDLAEKTVFFVNSMLLLSSSVIGFKIFEQQGEVKAAEFLTGLMRLYLLSAPLLVLALAVLSSQIVGVMLPDEYARGSVILPIVAFGGLFVGVMHRYSLLLSFHKRTDAIMWSSAAALLVNLVSCFVLIPLLGLIGAAFSTIVAYGSCLLFVRLLARRHLAPVFPWGTLVRVAVAMCPAAAVMYSLAKWSSPTAAVAIAVSLVFGFATYLFSLVCLKEISWAQLVAIKGSFSSRFRSG